MTEPVVAHLLCLSEGCVGRDVKIVAMPEGEAIVGVDVHNQRARLVLCRVHDPAIRPEVALLALHDALDVLRGVAPSMVVGVAVRGCEGDRVLRLQPLVAIEGRLARAREGRAVDGRGCRLLEQGGEAGRAHVLDLSETLVKPHGMHAQEAHGCAHCPQCGVRPLHGGKGVGGALRTKGKVPDL
eukprot:CAMPEP_0204525090 /NCGR_PEP_ID=MMETSP0661-20131031/7721_1 /ASSEMBLY_ACC=CAM_ASM_000606 /TAXON_ID=109239 /ORGANISM="Alexandrium margalefi, Strain AMGDE01CS-322" /LENGTH=183 /DNA_ID=CAMNT_0051530875 /DNA_START=329 /DNA_END=877 /DNA_ORIENTATION=-